MKTVISNKTRQALEVAKSIFYSMQVLSIGLFIPFMFVFGVTYNLPKVQNESEVHVTQPRQAHFDNSTVDLGKVLSAQKS